MKSRGKIFMLNDVIHLKLDCAEAATGRIRVSAYFATLVPASL